LQPFRTEPNLPVHAYKTYAITSPISTHYREARCTEAGCLAQRNGWKTVVDESTALGQKQAFYIRSRSGRKYVETRTGGTTEFVFEAGQQCFATHQVPLDRPELYVVRGGDFRGNPTGEVRRFSSPDAFVNDFGEHQDRLARVING
jgi:hypothetical protein